MLISDWSSDVCSSYLFFYAINTDFTFFNSNPIVNDNYFIHSLTHTIIYKGNTSYLGLVLYSLYNHFVLISSLILLVSMIDAIILTVDFEYRVKKNKDRKSIRLNYSH